MEDSNTPAPPRTVSRSDLPRLLAEFESSNVSLAAFARERGIASWQLYDARRKARTPQALVPVRVSAPVPPAAATIELRLASERRLLLEPGFDEATLRRLLLILESC